MAEPSTKEASVFVLCGVLPRFLRRVVTPRKLSVATFPNLG